MQTAALETLVTISRVGSFSRAADLRNMTLSALSMQMKALEHELDVTLFDRSFRPPRLTPMGARLAHDALRVVEAETALRARCAPQGRLAGTIQIGFVQSAAARILPEFLRQATQIAPEAAFRFSSALSETLCEQVRQGRLDAALVTEIADATFDLHSDPLAREEMVIVAPAARETPQLTDLPGGMRFIHFMPRSGIGRLIAQYLREMNLETGEPIVLDSIEAIVNCVRKGLGYSLVPRPDVLHYGADAVRHFSCTPAPVYRRLSLVTRTGALTDLWRPHLRGLLADSFAAEAPA